MNERTFLCWFRTKNDKPDIREHKATYPKDAAETFLHFSSSSSGVVCVQEEGKATVKTYRVERIVTYRSVPLDRAEEE